MLTTGVKCTGERANTLEQDGPELELALTLVSGAIL